MPVDNKLSRRQFAVGALAVAGSAALPAAVAQETSAPKLPTPDEAKEPKLSPAARAEAEQRLQALLAKYGSRLNDDEKRDLRKQVMQGQDALEKLRAFRISNWDEPALALRIADSE